MIRDFREFRSLMERSNTIVPLTAAQIWIKGNQVVLVGFEDLSMTSDPFVAWQIQAQANGRHLWLFDHRPASIAAAKKNSHPVQMEALRRPALVRVAEKHEHFHVNLWDMPEGEVDPSRLINVLMVGKTIADPRRFTPIWQFAVLGPHRSTRNQLIVTLARYFTSSVNQR